MLIDCMVVESPEDISKFEQIYQQYKGVMFYRAREILQDDFLAEDAVSNAFWKIAENIEKISEVECPKTRRFVVIIVERQAIDLYRRRSREEAVSIEELKEEPGRLDDITNGMSPLGAAMAKLPLNYREVLLLKFSEGYSNREIGKMLGYSVSKVEKLISRGKNKLKELLREEGVTE